MSMNIADLAQVLTEFNIQSIADLRARLGHAPPVEIRNTSPDWHSGYQQGFLKAKGAEVQGLRDESERLRRRIEVLERDFKSALSQQNENNSKIWSTISELKPKKKGGARKRRARR